MKSRVSHILLIAVIAIVFMGCTSKGKEEKQEQPAVLFIDNIAYSEDGYYTCDNYEQIKFYDNTSKKIVPLCSKPECSHEDWRVCNSYIQGMQSGIQYLEGKIYYLATNEEMQLALYRQDKDGNNREQVTMLVESFLSSDYIIPFRVEGGYVSIRISKLAEDQDTIQSIYIKEISSNEPVEMIYEAKNPGELVNLPQIYKGKAYYNSTYYKTIDEKIVEYGDLYTYDLETKQAAIQKEGANAYFVISGDELFYSNRSFEIRKLDLDTQQDENLITMDKANKFFYISVDADYLYVDNLPVTRSTYEGGDPVRKIWVYTHAGELVDTLVLEGNSTLGVNLYGEMDKIVLYELGSRIMLFDKEQIGKGTYNWDTIELENQ